MFRTSTTAVLSLLACCGISQAAMPYDTWPEPSADGESMYFYSYRNGKASIYAMHADGSDQHRISNTDYHHWWPQASDDGTLVVFHSDKGFDSYSTSNLFVLELGTGFENQLTVGENWIQDASFIPGTPQIIYSKRSKSEDGQAFEYVGLFKMNVLTGSEEQFGTGESTDTYPIVATDGKTIFFVRSFGNYNEIMSMSVDGSDIRQLTDSKGLKNKLAINDQAVLAFGWMDNGELSDEEQDDRVSEIYTFDTISGATRRLTENEFSDHSPVWSKDGQKLWYASYEYGFAEIFAMNPDGSGKANLTNTSVARHDFPYRSRYVDVLGSRMHYVDTGGVGSVVVMIHGQPTWSYLWRNIIPHLEDEHRVIALDLIGFGKSDKPDIGYTAVEHAKHLQGFLDALELDDMTLVVHDWGSILGFDFAANNPERVNAIAFMEAAIQTAPREEPSTNFEGFANILRLIKTPGQGEQMILEDNFFLEQLVLPGLMTVITADEAEAYREPFSDGKNRQPMLQFPRDVPIDGANPAYTVDMMQKYNAYLRTQENLPKLLLHLDDGFLIDLWDVEWMRSNFSDLTITNMGPGGHFLQEYNPDGIGKAISTWMRESGL